MKKLIIGAALVGTLLGGAAITAQTQTDVAKPHDPAARMAHLGDTNGDGAVSRDEYLAKAARRFDAMDANKDGKVTPDEAKAARQARWEGHRGPGHHGPGGPGGAGMMPPPGGPGGMLARLDTNGDGKISRAEFNAPGDRRFDILDTNKDGVIDQAEQKAAQEKMRAHFEEMRAKWHAKGGNASPPPPAGQTAGE